LISLNKINEYYKKIKNYFFKWLGVNLSKTNDTNTVENIEKEEKIHMNKSEKDILTDIVIENHEEEFRIKETGDDG